MLCSAASDLGLHCLSIPKSRTLDLYGLIHPKNADRMANSVDKTELDLHFFSRSVCLNI